MRANVPDYEVIAPRDLSQALGLLADGGWRPIAGATDVMVLFEAGKLAHRKWISIRHLAELRGIEVTGDHRYAGRADHLHGCDAPARFLAEEFPMLG